MDKTDNRPAFARNSINLASAGLGARAIRATDEFFAPLPRMLQDSDAVFLPDEYDDNGKWMDGWETRRRRNGGHDVGVIALAARGRIRGFDVDTSHFTGNYAPACRIEAIAADADPADDAAWVEILPTQQLGPSASHFFACDSEETWTHLRLHIYPDGGVARLRVYGDPVIDPKTADGSEIDLASALNGGRIIGFSDAHYGSYHRMLAPGRGLNMGDGWETRRRREPGFDWIVVKLGTRGRIARAVVDTAFYKGNYPDSFSIQAADLSDFKGDLDKATVTTAMFWDTLIDQRKLGPDAEHEFSGTDLHDLGPVTHIRLNIHPDGGISRLRLFGTPE
jgi:allantoicase